MTDAITIEIDHPRNRNLSFAPLGRTIRGKLDFARSHDPGMLAKLATYPQAIPGQRLSIDPATGEAFLLEPLRDAENAPLRETIERRGMSVAPASEALGPQDVATFLYWMKRAIDSGAARLVEGKIPTKLGGKPKLSFISAEQSGRDEKLDALTTAVTKMAEAIEKLVSAKA